MSRVHSPPELSGLATALREIPTPFPDLTVESMAKCRSPSVVEPVSVEIWLGSPGGSGGGSH